VLGHGLLNFWQGSLYKDENHPKLKGLLFGGKSAHPLPSLVWEIDCPDPLQEKQNVLMFRVNITDENGLIGSGFMENENTG